MTRYLVTRTSIYHGNEKPCDGAIIISRQDWQYSTFKTEEAYDKNRGLYDKKWREEGTEHKSWAFGICRRLENKKVWAIDIESLDDFVKAIKWRSIILSTQNETEHGPDEEPMLQIEIYDDYRE